MTITELPHRTESRDANGTRSPRWQPTRAGILNIWRYYDETFEFHDGRLLLRGPNGTGKSKALELLLPYLFDASLRANRLSTFGTSERTMHWNLMGEGATGTTRVGYVWLEFARLPERNEWFTCGARLQATSRTTNVTPDYFTTSRRIGTDLALTNSAGQPLTRAVLAEELGNQGIVHPNGTEYRNTVRQALFPGLSEQRYESLITALLQLRTPKLSERLDPGLLSTLLSRALPPLDEEDIAELAEGFERLDKQREQLVKLDTEAEAAKKVASRQRSYAQRVLRAAAGKLTHTAGQMEKATRLARESEQAYQETVTAKVDAEDQIAELDRRIERTNAAIDGLTNSEAYREGQQLDELRTRADTARRVATERHTAAEQKTAEASDDAEQAEQAGIEAEQHGQAVRVAAEDSGQAARRAGLDSAYAEIAAELDRRGERARQLLGAAVQGKQESIREVRGALERHARAVDARVHAENVLEEARGELSEWDARRAELAATYTTVVQQHGQDLIDWAHGCDELVFDDPAALADHAESETEVRNLVTDAAERRLQDIAAQETSLTTRREAAEATRTELADQIADLQREIDLPPQPPPHRTADRTELAGAPLWKLVMFVDGVRPGTQAAVEAALQASGLLDAWLMPSGEVSIAGHDTLAAADLVEPAGRSLCEVLRPEPDGAVPGALVERLLSSVAFGETLPAAHPAAIGADGRWRLGTITGSWAKEDIEHIGALARERGRQRRIAELTTQVAELDQEIETLRAQLTSLDHHRHTLASERERMPSHEPVSTARRDLDRTESEVAAADRAVRRATDQLTQREEETQQAQHALHFAGTEHGLPTDREALDTLDRALEVFRDNAETWLTRHVELVGVQQRAELLRERAERSAAAAEDGRISAEDAAADAETLTEKLHAVESTIGADYRQVLAEIAALRQAREQLRDDRRAVDGTLGDLRQRLGSLDSDRSRHAEDRDAAVAARDTAVEEFRHLATGTFTDDAGIELALPPSAGVTVTLEAARSVAATLPPVSHEPKNIADAGHRLGETVHECRDVLSGRADLELETDGEIRVLTAVLDGARVGAHQLHDFLHAEAERSRGDITTSERELFDKTLTGDTRRQLAERIRQANEMVKAMNARLERVRTASQVAVQLVWQVDQELPAGTKDARELLLKNPVGLSDADKESLHRFFRDRIEQAKADNTASSWQEQLAQVFDYTAWHRFVVKLDRADGQGWRPLTKKLHGALSGGEKAIALHLPLFAAVAAHYQSVPEAPRLILLDEVFVGVDSSNRGQVFELLASLDLDLVLTSDHEWCGYRELPGIAVHQLITADGDADIDDAVTTTRFVWTGAGWTDEIG